MADRHLLTVGLRLVLRLLAALPLQGRLVMLHHLHIYHLTLLGIRVRCLHHQ